MRKTVFILYLFALVFSPIFFGAVHTYAYSVMTFSVLTASLLLLKNSIKKDENNAIWCLEIIKTPFNITFILILIFLLFQIIPLPSFIIKLFSHETYEVLQKSVPASSISGIETGVNGLFKGWHSLAVYYYPVRMSIIRFTVYGLFFLGLINVLNTRKRIEIIIITILITGCLESVYGLTQAYTESGNILWFSKSILGSQRDVTGTYINRNHFAGFMEMGIILAVCYASSISIRKRRKKNNEVRSFRKKALDYLAGEKKYNKRFLVIFSAIIMGIGLIFSASRGGIISAVISFVFMGWMFGLKKRQTGKRKILLFIFLVISVYAVNIGMDYVIERFDYFNKSFERRYIYAEKTMEIFEDYSLTGIGLGNFSYVFPKYQSSKDKGKFLRHAHNDWAQLMAEAGIIGFLIIIGSFILFFYTIFNIWKKRKGSFAVSLGIAPFAAVIAIGIHSYSDFNLHMPANFLLLVAITAIGWSALHLNGHGKNGKTEYNTHVIPLNYKGFAIFAVIFGFIILNGNWALRHFMAEINCNTAHNSTLNRDQNPPLNEIQKAIEWDSVNAAYWNKLAIKLLKLSSSENDQDDGHDDSQDDYKGKDNKINEIQKSNNVIEALENAIALNPFKTVYHIRLGWAYVEKWRTAESIDRWVKASDASFLRAEYFMGVSSAELHYYMGNYWLLRSKMVRNDTYDWHLYWSKAVKYFRNAQYINRNIKLAEKIERDILNYYDDKEKVEEAVLDKNRIIMEKKRKRR